MRCKPLSSSVHQLFPLGPERVRESLALRARCTHSTIAVVIPSSSAGVDGLIGIDLIVAVRMGRKRSLGTLVIDLPERRGPRSDGIVVSSDSWSLPVRRCSSIFVVAVGML